MALFRTVLFDFDQTLVDSAGPVVRCIDYAFERMGRPPVSAAAGRSTIGLPLADAFHQLTGDPDPDAAASFAHHFFEVADEIIVKDTGAFPGVPEALDELAAAGYRLGIVSTKRRHRIDGILLRLGLAHRFDAVVGGSDVELHKPSPEGIHAALERLETGPADAVFVGDHVVDGQAALAASVAFVGVLTGTGDRTSLSELAPLALLESVVALPGWLRAA